MEDKITNWKKEIPVYYTNIYNLIIQSRMFDRIERELAILFASYGPVGGCNWSRASLKEYCECGPYHLERAIKRLQYWRVIKVVKGGWSKNSTSNQPRKETNRYVFEKDPYKWKVTKEIQEKIIQETLNMKLEASNFEHAPFPNKVGFEKSFESTYPKYAQGRKGRKKSSEEVPEKNSPDELIWIDKIADIESSGTRILSIALEYFKNYELVQQAHSSDHGMAPKQEEYYCMLALKMKEKLSSDLDDNELKIAHKINNGIDEGLTPREIFRSLLVD